MVIFHGYVSLTEGISNEHPKDMSAIEIVGLPPKCGYQQKEFNRFK